MPAPTGASDLTVLMKLLGGLCAEKPVKLAPHAAFAWKRHS